MQAERGLQLTVGYAMIELISTTQVHNKTSLPMKTASPEL